MIKRFFCIFVSLIALIVLFPVVVIIAFEIRRKLGSPVFFRQIRAGKEGRPFEMMKFRTMQNAIDEKGRLLPDSDRMVPIGNFLRKSSLDELPELWNVLKGDMSLVGPRPLLMEYLPLYNENQKKRHDLLPGITGWAQVNGRNDIKLLLIGDGMMKHSLEARAVSKGLVNIIFHDPVSKESLAGLMRSVDIGMQLLANVPAFYYGTSPNKFFDYISAGLPVVSNYPGWIADMIQKHDCGYIVPPGDPELFADALCCAADNKDKTRHMSENALKLAYKFDRKVLYQDWESCLKRAFEQAL